MEDMATESNQNNSRKTKSLYHSLVLRGNIVGDALNYCACSNNEAGFMVCTTQCMFWVQDGAQQYQYPVTMLTQFTLQYY